jgi:hypothetical protein
MSDSYGHSTKISSHSFTRPSAGIEFGTLRLSYTSRSLCFHRRLLSLTVAFENPILQAHSLVNNRHDSFYKIYEQVFCSRSKFHEIKRGSIAIQSWCQN